MSSTFSAKEVTVASDRECAFKNSVLFSMIGSWVLRHDRMSPLSSTPSNRHCKILQDLNIYTFALPLSSHYPHRRVHARPNVADGGPRKKAHRRGTNSLGGLGQEDEEEESPGGDGQCVTAQSAYSFGVGGSATFEGTTHEQAAYCRTSSRYSGGAIAPPSSGLRALHSAGVFEGPPSTGRTRLPSLSPLVVVPADSLPRSLPPSTNAVVAVPGGAVRLSSSAPGSPGSGADAGVEAHQQRQEEEAMPNAKWGNQGLPPIENVVVEPSRKVRLRRFWSDVECLTNIAGPSLLILLPLLELQALVFCVTFFKEYMAVLH